MSLDTDTERYFQSVLDALKAEQAEARSDTMAELPPETKARIWERIADRIGCIACQKCQMCQKS